MHNINTSQCFHYQGFGLRGQTSNLTADSLMNFRY